jgi:competence protein ComEC
MLWITHQHSDHLGGAAAILAEFSVDHYVDNGRDLGRPQVKRTREVASRKGISITVVTPESREVPVKGGQGFSLNAVLPSAWPKSCKSNENDCSIGLRIDYCASSIVFVGDAEAALENAIQTTPATLLQVGHHGSESSSLKPFINRIAPRYAVISAGGVDEALNTRYCHPRRAPVELLSNALGGPRSRTLRVFDGKAKCTAKSRDWVDLPVSDSLWATSRDGDVTLVTRGDGIFARERVSSDAH